MKHRQRPQVHGLRREAEHERVTERVEVGAPMVIQHPFRISRRARCVEQRRRIPLVGGRSQLERRVALRDPGLVVDRPEVLALRSMGIVDVDHQWLALRPIERRADHRRELAVGDQHFGLAVVEAEGDGRRVESVVERIENRVEPRNRVVRLQKRGHVRRHHGDRVAAADARGREHRSEPPAALLELAIGVGALAVDHRGLPGIDLGSAPQEIDRCQRREVGRAALEQASPCGGCAARPRARP